MKTYTGRGIGKRTSVTHRMKSIIKPIDIITMHSPIGIRLVKLVENILTVVAQDIEMLILSDEITKLFRPLLHLSY